MSEDGGRPWAQEPAVPFSQKPDGAEKIWQAIAPAAPSRPPTPRAMLAAMYGRGARGRVNTRAAAEALGVSQRTVQRWIKDRKLPSSAAGDAVRAQHQRWRDSPAGRSSTLGRKLRGQLAGARRFTFSGDVKVSSDVRKRPQMLVQGWPPENMQALIDRLEAGDDAGAHRELEKMVTASADWGSDVYLKIDSITFEGLGDR